MADTWGAVQHPLAAPAAGFPVADPALHYLGSFVQAVLRSDGANAWATVSRQNICQKHFTHDPEEADVKITEFPCVFVWSPDSQIQREADDYLTDKREFQILWMFENVRQSRVKDQMPFFNGLVKVLLAAFDKGRHPAWVVDGDPDTNAATRGSIIWKWCGFYQEQILKPQTSGITIEYYDGGKMRPMSGILLPIVGWEKRTEDTGLYVDTKNTTDLTDPDDDDSVIRRAIEDPAES